MDLYNPKSGLYYDEMQELIDKYLLGDHSLEIINALIVELVDDEPVFYAEEDFYYLAIYRTPYNIISQDTFNKLQKNKILSPTLNYSSSMWRI